LLEGHGLHTGNVEGNRMHLPAHGTVFAKLDKADRLLMERGLETANLGKTT